VHIARASSGCCVPPLVKKSTSEDGGRKFAELVNRGKCSLKHSLWRTIRKKRGKKTRGELSALKVCQERGRYVKEGTEVGVA